MSEPLVRFTQEDKVAVLTMDDGKANALSFQMIDELLAALERAEREAGAVVLAGRDGKFCAGFDLKVMMSGPDNAIALLTRGAELLLRLFEFPLPVVMAVTGHAMAGGVLVVCTGDLRIGAEGNFNLGLNEVAIGLPVPLLAMELARSRLLPTELTRATLLAQLYKPTEARAAGYLDQVVAPDALAATALAEGKRLAALPRAAYTGTKQRLRAAIARTIREGHAADVQRALGK